ncbi:putative tail tube protein [Edwardsiella phage pEt-SU]|uniref:Putative tail tube protein n=1 Tax=Edwardsiella phage pEt-SU TaxID=2562142 RepID=A0A4D6DX74_9CAUD|nr:virion structural protein [Edwardsiella phage pEt-SU]QBZ70808.1 putative tail tube protein [Edwardsiella phage pEt-SU]
MASNFPHRDNLTLMPGNSDFKRAFDIGNTPIINAANGGQYGFAPNNFRYVQEQPYVSQRPYCVNLSTPAAFSNLPGGKDLHGLLRAYMETRSREWSGLTVRTSVDYHDITWAGGSTLSFPVGSTRQFGSISHMALDPEGETFSKMFDTWISYLLSDPTIRHPKIITLGYSGELLLDEISMSSVYFEPTRNWQDVRHAVIVLGQMPKEGPNYEFSFNVEQASGQVREISTEFTGLMEFDTLAAKEIARAVMKRMPLYNPGGRAAPSGFKTVTANLAAIKDNGIVDSMNKDARTIQNPNFMGG